MSIDIRTHTYKHSMCQTATIAFGIHLHRHKYKHMQTKHTSNRNHGFMYGSAWQCSVTSAKHMCPCVCTVCIEHPPQVSLGRQVSLHVCVYTCKHLYVYIYIYIYIYMYIYTYTYIHTHTYIYKHAICLWIARTIGFDIRLLGCDTSLANSLKPCTRCGTALMRHVYVCIYV